LRNRALGDEEGDPRQRHLLRLQNDLGEPDQPASDVQRFLVDLELVVIGLPVPFDRIRQRDQARLADVLGKGLFRQGAAEATIAIFEGVDAFEPEVPKSCSGQSRQGRWTVWCRSVEPVDEHVHLTLDMRRRRCFEMHRRSVDPAGDDLHRVGMSPVGTDGLEASVMCQEHPVPAAEGLVGQRRAVGRVDVDHHLCDALFLGLRWRTVRDQTELPPEGGLHTAPV
jgi:hypothetical protein